MITWLFERLERGDMKVIAPVIVALSIYTWNLKQEVKKLEYDVEILKIEKADLKEVQRMNGEIVNSIDKLTTRLETRLDKIDTRIYNIYNIKNEK